MKRLMLSVLCLFSAIGISMNYANNREIHKSDKYIRDRVIMITGGGMECSAIEVKAPSGKVYTVSAAHCSEMLIGGYALATAENGVEKNLKMIQIDFKHDLMLLEACDKNSINVAKDSYTHQHVHTLTHGQSMPTFRTDGELLEERVISIMEPLWDSNSMDKCQKLGREIVMSPDGFGCMFKLNLMMSTAKVVPGSSGGAVLNIDGELVGIVSATDGFFSAFVPLDDIKDFLKAR